MLLYRIFLLLYPLAARLAGFFNIKARKWTKAQAAALNEIEQWQPKRPVIWMHCASLGEFEQGLPVLQAIRREYPGYAILLSFFSPSGYEPCSQHPIADKVVYLPLDGPHTAKRWINSIHPALVIFVKYEFWYFYLQALHNRNIPVLLIAAIFRSSQPFFHWYGGLYRKMLAFYHHILVQDQSSADLLATLAVSVPVVVAGDTRFDRVLQIAQNPITFPAIETLIQGKKVFVAGSTWPEDDKALRHFVSNTPEVFHIIVPHLTDAATIERCLQTYPDSISYSEWQKKGMTSQANMSGQYKTLIIDTIGMLSSLYRHATVAYVGGGFGAEGIHNVLEATVHGIPVVIGPVYDKFREAVELVERKGIYVAATVIELDAHLILLLKDENLRSSTGETAKKYTREGAGSADKVIQIIQAKRLLTR
ncbi:MAG: 3-deoxy-D-manno-octulosonic acid transferase [Chitinophagaceae bacterium]|nr:3-deoxy-D-manno-octulosonic acid transferase [Chitinophagaceae bacterium]